MGRAKFILLLMLTIPFLPGFSWSKSKVESIQGVWKCEVPNHNGYISFLEIGKDYIAFYDYNRFHEEGLILEEVEGVVLVRKAGMSEVVSRIIIRDADHIIVEFPRKKLGFIRSSAEEKSNIFNPPIDKVVGFYSSQDGAMRFEFSKNNVVKNGVSLDVSLFSEDQMYFAVTGGILQFALAPIEDGKLLYRDRPGGSPITLIKVAPDKAIDNFLPSASPLPLLPPPLLPSPPVEEEWCEDSERSDPYQDILIKAAPGEAGINKVDEAGTNRIEDLSMLETTESPAMRSRSIDMSSDLTMRHLASKYTRYMDKLTRQMQESFDRKKVLWPTSLSKGQVKIHFGISPDGSLNYYDTIYPVDGEMVSERRFSEQMLREAAPFEPLTQQMTEEPGFLRMVVSVNFIDSRRKNSRSE